MTSTRRRKRGTITIRPVLQTRVETAFDYYRRKALLELERDAENMRRALREHPIPSIVPLDWQPRGEYHEWRRYRS